MSDGSEVYLKIQSWPPGFAKVTLDGVGVYGQPRPRGFDFFLLLASFAAPFLTFKVWIAAPLGVFSMWLVGWWFKQPTPSVRVKRCVVGGVILAEVILAIVVLIAVIQILG
jgi:hypothetical protein